MIKCVKVIACYLGSRRELNSNPKDMLEFIHRIIENEINIENGYPTDIIVAINNCGNPELDGSLEKYNNQLTKNGKIVIFNRENYGASFGCYFDSFYRYKNDYTHWFFCEDDVLIYKEKYMKSFVDFFESNKETIGFVSLAPISNFIKMHSGGGCGLVSTEWMSSVYTDDEIINDIFPAHRKSDNDYSYFENLEIEFTGRLTKDNKILMNHPDYNCLCENYINHSSQFPYSEKKIDNLEFIYIVGNK
jgi:hypothetical protein